MGRGAAFHAPLGYRHLTVVTLPAFATGGAVTGYIDGAAFSDTVPANTPYRALAPSTARRDLTIVSSNAGDAEYGYTSALAPGRGWLCQAAGGGFAENFAHIGEVWLASTSGATVRINEG